MNDEFNTIRRQSSWLFIYPGSCLKALEKTTNKRKLPPRQPSPDRELNSAGFEYEAGLLNFDRRIRSIYRFLFRLSFRMKIC
jgi:hypothetical protein